MRSVAIATSVLLAGCTMTVGEASNATPPIIPDDVFVPLNGPADAHAELCDHDPGDTTFPDQADRITNRFCQDVKGGVVPEPTGLADLLQILGLDFKDPSGENGVGGNPGFAILGHSSALTARKVSSITPTVFVFTPLLPDGSLPPDYIFLAFDPGEPFVEVASFSPADQVVNFYLVIFDKECSHSARGCTPDDLLTPNQLTGWSNVRIYESTTALNNTIMDCRQCHIGNGTDNPDNPDPLILRMQEIDAPHTHWFDARTEGGRALLEDFHAAHGHGESYGPIPAALIDKSDPELMAQFIRVAGFADQPNPFRSADIEAEVKASAPGQPAINVPIGASATWDSMFEAAESGQFIPAPYHDVKVTDPVKLGVMTNVYRSWRKGTGPLQVDVRDVFLDDALAEMGFAGVPGMSGKQLLVQQCQQCHHRRLDPSISRDKFLVDDLSLMSREEKELAIDRINLPVDDVLTMPPPLFRSTTQAERDLMIDELRR